MAATAERTINMGFFEFKIAEENLVWRDLLHKYHELVNVGITDNATYRWAIVNIVAESIVRYEEKRGIKESDKLHRAQNLVIFSSQELKKRQEHVTTPHGNFRWAEMKKIYLPSKRGKEFSMKVQESVVKLRTPDKAPEYH